MNGQICEKKSTVTNILIQREYYYNKKKLHT
jgi:hypothetical protein